MNIESFFSSFGKIFSVFLTFFLKEEFFWNALNFLKALSIFLIGLLISNLIAKMLKRTMLRVKISKSTVDFIFSATKLFLKILSLLFALTCFLDFNTVLATSGGILVALSFILKGSFSNVLSGIIIITNNLFSLEDTLEIETKKGQVAKIETFFTTLVTDDGKEIIVPNSLLTSQAIIKQNANHKKSSRI